MAGYHYIVEMIGEGAMVPAVNVRERGLEHPELQETPGPIVRAARTRWSWHTSSKWYCRSEEL